MANTSTVCTMCGDVGFPDKLFQCSRCTSRFQHSYCSNYYEEEPSDRAGVCDWCLSEERTRARQGSSSKKHGMRGEMVKKDGDQEERGKNSAGSSSSSPSKPAGRRYKLLKDVLR